MLACLLIWLAVRASLSFDLALWLNAPAMVVICNILTCVWLGTFAALSVRCLAAGARNSVLFVFPIHFIFCGLPLVGDILLGVPQYRLFPGFADAAHDQATCLVYCGFVSLCPILWWYFAGPLRRHHIHGKSRVLDQIRGHGTILDVVLIVVVLSPILLLAVAPDRSIYGCYSAACRQWYLRGSETVFHAILVKSIQLAIIAAAVLLLRARNLMARMLWVVPVIGVHCWLHGKRNIVAFAIFLIIYVLWSRGVLLRRRLAIATAAATFMFLAFSTFYQTNLRFNDYSAANRTMEQWLEGMRIDYGRDDVIKLNLYAELAPEFPPILDYRGESFVIVGTFFVPRWFWPNKPDSYAAHVMTAAMGGPSPGGGTMTTTILAEAIANFGWLGMLAGPVAVVGICRISDAFRDELLHVLALFITTGMLAVSFSYWSQVALLWIALIAVKLLQASASKPHPKIKLPRDRQTNPILIPEALR